jgi:hypothetical protein
MVYANIFSEIYTGVLVKQVVGNTRDENFPDLRKMWVPQKYAEVVRSQQAIELEDIYYGDFRVVEGWYAVKGFPLPLDCVGISFENITERRQVENERENLIKKLETALAEIKTLKGLLPICCHCKKIQDEDGCWNIIETYISLYSEAKCTDSYCPDCIRELYLDMAEEILA